MKPFLYSFLAFCFYTPLSQGQSYQAEMYQADSIFWTGDYQFSKILYQQAALQVAETDVLKYFSAVQKYSECMVRQGLFEQAEQELTTALQNCPVTALAEKAALLNTLSLSKIGEGIYDEAEEALDKSIALTSNIQEWKNSLADSYNNLSILYWTTGNNEKAMEYALQAMELRRGIYGEKSPFTAGSYMNLGLILQHNDPEQAIAYYDKAIQIYSDIFQPNHPLIASALINKGIVYQNEQTYNSSLDQFEKALAIIETSVGKTHINYAFTLSHIGNVYLQTDKPDQAQQYQLQALSIFTANVGDRHPEVAECYNELAAIQLYKHRYKEALDYYQQSLIANSFKFSNKNIYSNPFCADGIHADLMLTTLFLKAQALEEKHVKKDLKVKDLQFALHTLCCADSLSENIRHRRTHKKDKVELGKLTNDIYEQAIHLCIVLSEITLHKKSYEEQAFLFSEKNKAAVLLEAISDAKAKSFSGLPDELLKKESDIKNRMSYGEEMLKKASTDVDKAQWRTFVLKENRLYEDYIEKLEKDFPAYYDLKYSKNKLTVKDIQSKLPDSTLLFHYFVSDKYNTVYLFMVGPNKFTLIQKSKAETFDKELTAWRNSIRYRIKDQYILFGNQLSEQLLPHKIPEQTTLVVIPDGRLSAIPFEALFTQQAKEKTELPLLLKRAAISYNYSASLYLESLQKSKTGCSSGNVLLCAPVSFQGKMNDLPGTQQEVQGLASTFEHKGFVVQSFLNEQANESAVKKASSKQWSYIHWATHGLVNETDPDLSKIIFHGSQDDDGDLLSGELYNLNLKSELITLSACQTGLGKVTKGEGLIGLSRALLYAGASNLIVSLWNVSDQATGQLMSNLYTNILQNTDCINYAKALQQAKLNLLRNKETNEPYFWAPFILIGK
ncbi:MAG TPA: CHAT domain-containing tetratricopeptide repeat protein [Cytophagaceae bacterium]|nr:CHAT domain-containing tetratricopeptide repeat protein [Cytophagaceae bacterium]